MTSISFLTNYKFVLVSYKIFGFLNFHVSHLNYEKFKLCLQNTLNMPKTIRVYFGVLHPYNSWYYSGFGKLQSCVSKVFFKFESIDYVFINVWLVLLDLYYG